MRLLRLRVKDFRGIAEHDVRLLPTGVTVVQGPNEVGKSSLAEALDLLLFEQVTTTKRSVRAIRPSGRDIGSEIEAELEVGELALRYFKRFFRQTETVLTELAPRHRETTGRPAHERALQLLGERCDLDLWRALRVAQGEGWHQAELAGRASLLAALAGGARDTAPEDLFDRVRAECERYFTVGRWQPTGDLRDRRAVVAQLQPEVARLDARLDALQADVDRAGALEAEAGRLRAQLETAQQAAQAALERAEALHAKQAAVAVAEAAIRDAGRRVTLLEQYIGARRSRAELAEARAAADALQRRSAAAVDQARSRLAEARAAEEQAAAVLQQLRDDQIRRRDGAELARLRDRRAKAVELLGALASARADLERNRVDTAALADVQAAHAALERAEGAAAAGRPLVTVRALRDVTVVVGGDDLVLPGGAEHRVSVAGVETVRLPDAQVTVRAGADSADLERCLAQARAGYAAVCARVGAADLAEARRLHAERSRADRAAAEAVWGLAGLEVRLPAEDTADASALARLESSIARLDADLAAAATRADPTLAAEAAALAERCGGLAAAVAAAAEHHKHAAAAVQVAAEELARTQASAAQAEAAAGRLEAEGDASGRALSDAARRLADDGVDVEALGDAEVAAQLAAAATVARAHARARLAAARAGLEAADEPEVRSAAQAAGRRLHELEEGLATCEGDLRELRGGLAARAEDGLYERAARARAELARASAELSRVEARAAAARLLHDTMQAERDSARDGYCEPLREEIVTLGRHLYGDSFDVELDDDLRVASRTLDGTTVAFADLSLGAREQLSLLTRLACGLLVSDDGGVPLILDDTLGSSDEARLKRMAEVLSIAGERCQIIVLTCMPERFAGVHGARTVTLL